MSYNSDDVRQHKDESSAWITHKGRVFDITEFLSRHPGGKQVLLPKLGSDVTELMRDPQIHKHTNLAYNMLSKYYIGKLRIEGDYIDDDEPLKMEGYRENELVDWSKPMVAQVGKLGSEYMKWVHSPVNKPLRLFGPDFVEFFSKTPWYVVPMIWLPVVIYISFVGASQLARELPSFLTNNFFLLVVFFCLFMMGLFLWTFIEYVLHRYVFHISPPDNSPFWITFHFFIHGQHHKVPFDSNRLVFPPVAASVFAIFFYSFLTFLLPHGIANCLFSGGLFGYILYDCIHYYLHHGSPDRGSYLHGLKSYHVAHHFEDSFKGFGISSKIWDYPFNTVPIKYQ
ncbi:fatty acid 2-hydroxylase-like [Xenia sp. Carnegie-2017]|uniref:fatty acid 2-hydroxylase-like n=1 Tax=Xenia sp. Carnegie-2017 TaxID=2897299 RepID=UPI001F03ED34|nr:fatty acid 2-hydroxylase-like [Xenia sp. Carnegie-2017]